MQLKHKNTTKINDNFEVDQESDQDDDDLFNKYSQNQQAHSPQDSYDAVIPDIPPIPDDLLIDYTTTNTRMNKDQTVLVL